MPRVLEKYNMKDLGSARAIQTLIQENENLKNTIPKAHISTTSTQLTDSAEDLPIENVKIKGATSQIQYEGRNQWNENTQTFENKSYFGKSIKDDKNVWTFTVTGNGYAFTESTKVLPAGTYIFSAIVNNGNFAVMQGSHFLANPFTLTEETTISLRVYKSEAVSGDVVTLSNVMLEQGSTAHDYEPYVGGQPAPNPAYPQLIHRVTGDCNAKVQNKNLFDIGEVSDYSPTDRVTSTANSILTFLIMASSSTYTYNTKKNFAGNTTYTITAKTSAAYSRCFVRLRNSDDTAWLTGNDATITGWSYNRYYGGWYKDNSSINVNFSITIPSCLYCQFGFGYSNNVAQAGETQTISEIQIEKSSTASETYVPHAEQNAPLSLGNIEAYEGDEIEIDYVQKAGYKKVTGARFVENTGEVVLNENASIFKNSNDTTNYLYYFVTGNKQNGNTLSNKLTQKTINSINAGNSINNIGFAEVAGNNTVFYFNVGFYMTENTIANLKQFLSTNNITFKYRRATPITTPITDPILLAQLETLINMKTYKEVTNIELTGEDLAPVLDCDYYQDMSTLNDRLDELEARIELLEE